MTKMFEGDPDYEKIKAELEPYVTRITKVKGKATSEYQQFRKNVREWNERFSKAALTAGAVESIQKLQIPLWQELRTTPESRRLLAVIGLFRYLGLVESLGVTVLDLLMILLTANERDFHVERIHDLPRIVHATSFDDLESAPLAAKIAFLERSGLKETSKFIDRLLRNDIAHLDFNIDAEGKISTKSYGNVNIFERINKFSERLMMITLILSQEGLSEVTVG